MNLTVQQGTNFMKKSCLILICALTFICTNQSIATNLSEELSTKIALLSQEKPFINFSLGLTAEEKNLLSLLEITKTTSYDYYGAFPEKKDISSFIQSLGNNKDISSSVATIISQKIQDIKEAFNAEAVWVTIRSSHAVDDYSTPRWHTDGYMYSPMTELQYKTAFVLKGASTLFCHLSDEGRIKFNVIQDELGQIVGQYIKEGQPKDELYVIMAKYQYQLAKLIQEYKDKQQASIEQGSINYGSIFVLGDKNSAAIHSEPHVDSDRLFISVVAGTKDQIQENHDNQKNL